MPRSNIRSSKNIRKIVQSELNKNIETKFKCLEISGVAITTGGFFIPLSQAITQGTGIQNRVGDQVYLKRFVMNHVISRDDATNIMRVMLVRSLKAPLTISDMPNLHECPDTKNMFVYFDKYFTFASSVQEFNVMSKNVRLGNKANWDTSNADNGGHIYLYYISDSSSSGPTLNLHGKTWYKDA